jgi:hypothetical protein
MTSNEEYSKILNAAEESLSKYNEDITSLVSNLRQYYTENRLLELNTKLNEIDSKVNVIRDKMVSVWEHLSETANKYEDILVNIGETRHAIEVMKNEISNINEDRKGTKYLKTQNELDPKSDTNNGKKIEILWDVESDTVNSYQPPPPSGDTDGNISTFIPFSSTTPAPPSFQAMNKLSRKSNEMRAKTVPAPAAKQEQEQQAGAKDSTTPDTAPAPAPSGKHSVHKPPNEPRPKNQPRRSMPPTVSTPPNSTTPVPKKKITVLPNEIIVNAEMFPISWKNSMGNNVGKYIIYFDKKSRMPFSSTDLVDFFLTSLLNSANNSDKKVPQKNNFPSYIERIVFKPTSKSPDKKGGAKDFVIYKKPKKTRKRKHASRTHTKKHR